MTSTVSEKVSPGPALAPAHEVELGPRSSAHGKGRAFSLHARPHDAPACQADH